MVSNKRFERNPMNKVVGGVCSGLADYFNLDVALIRVLFVVALLFASFGFWLYIILWIVIPEKKMNFDYQTQQTAESTASTPAVDEDSKKTTAVIAGVSVALIGVIFLINNFIPISWVWKLWPLILVAIGIVMIVNAVKKGGENE